MMNTSLTGRNRAHDEEIRITKRVSHGPYKAFKLAATQADMTDKEALDQAFKLFAAAVKHEMEKAGGAA